MFLWTPEGFISQESFLNLFLNLYIPLWLRKNFKFIVLRLLQIYLWVKKLNLFIFTHTLRQNSPSPPPHPHPPRFLSLSSSQTGIAHSSVFWRYFFLRRKGERIMELKKLPKLTKILVKSLDKSHHLCNLVLLCNNLASGILKCESSLT